VAPVEEKVFTEHEEQDLTDDLLQIREALHIKSHLEASLDFSQDNHGNDDKVA